MVFKKQDLLELNKKIRQENCSYYIEFEQDCILEYIKIYLDEEYIWSEAKFLTLSYCDENGEFKDFDSIKVYSSELVCFELKSKIKTREIKLYAEDSFELKDIKIFSRKYPGLMLAARADGLGARLLPLLNAYVLSYHTGFKFGYTWHYWKDFSWFNDFTQIDENQLSSIGTGKENEIFSQEFIKEYSYTKNLICNRGYIKHVDLNRLKSLPYDKDWGWYVSYTLTYQGIFKNTKDIGILYKKAWEWIGFSKDIKEIINDASRKADENFKDFIAIHVRSGDGVFNPKTRISQNSFWLKTCPTEIAMELIEENRNENIVLFGDDFNQIKELKIKYSKTHKIFTIEEFIVNLQEYRRNFFEISFMSKSKKIYSGDSSFAKVAAYVGLGDDPTFYYHYYNFEAMYSIVKKHFFRLDRPKVHTLQKAYTCYFLYQCAKQCGFREEKLKYILMAHSFDITNPLYIVSVLLCYYEMGLYTEAQDFVFNINLDEILPLYFSSLFFNESHVLLYEFAKRFPYNKSFLKIVSFLQNKNSNLKNIQNQIPLYSAKARIHNHLAYKLGQSMIKNSKTFLSYMKMPYILIALSIAHREEQKIKCNDILPPLESYPDYKEALKEKECFTYKLGLALMKAHKKWYGGGYLVFFFKELPKLKEEFKRKKHKF